MMANDPTMDAIRGRLLLVSAPWALFNRPSLPLGVLKAYLAKKLPGLSVTTHHLFLQMAGELGLDRYQTISERVWRAESVFAALLFPERADTAERLFHATGNASSTKGIDFAKLVESVRSHCDQWLRSIDGIAWDMIGFSVSFCQVTASLYLVSRIKAIRPDLPIVVGGSSFAGAAATDLIELFPAIDYVVVGEGEQPLVDLLCRHGSDDRKSMAPMVNGVVTKHTPPSENVQFCQLRELDELPVPDYDDYFKTLSRLAPERRFFPTLPLEASRGCWWQRSDSQKTFNGCAFCNLNLQWSGYRTKAPDQVIDEIDRLTGRYQVLSLAFADNAFPLKDVDRIIEGIRHNGRQLSIFTELRADPPPAMLESLRSAGIDTVQVGIEALSSRLLKKMNKGTRAIDNICLMKHCLACGIDSASNLMLHFPSSDANDVADTLYALDFVTGYRPLKTVSFWLGLSSPVHRFAKRFDVRAVYPHPNLKKLFPARVADRLPFMIQGYRGDRQRQKRLWRPVQQKVDQWTKAYGKLMRQTRGRPALVYRDGRQFLIIAQHRPERPVERHRLTGDSAAIYRYCDVPRSLDQLAETFGAHGRDAVRTFLDSMVKKRLMFAESGHYLSLAVPAT